MLIALAIVMGVTTAICAMLSPASGAFQVVPEAADVRQRLSASADAIAADLLSAGTLPSVALNGDARAAAPPVFPFRLGRRLPDAAGTFDPTRITTWYVKRGGAESTLAAPLASADGVATITLGPSCPPGDLSCGFRAGMTVAVIDRYGGWDLFSVTAVLGTALTLQHNLRDTASALAPGDAAIAEVVVRTYQFKNDAATGVGQLVRYDGDGAADAPVVDHLVALKFEYSGEAQPPLVIPPATSWDDVRSSYGPIPPAPDAQPTAYPAGENCVFSRDGAGAAVPRLPALAAGTVQIALAPSMLTDGPWCPDAVSANRYDADLLRVRTVTISLRTESALTSLRGPAGPLFTRAGTARGSRFVPDRDVRLVITARGAGS
jgi:hypothetical protein